MAMKKIIFSTIFFLAVAGVASAQTSKVSGSKTTTYTSTSSHKAKKQPNKKTSTAKIKSSGNSTVVPDNRKEYMENGQLATRTGHEAAPTNGQQFQSLKKDSANKKRKKQY